jgi:hypothetical protein
MICAFVVDPARAVITASGESEADAGVRTPGRLVAAAPRFRDAWGGREYHPLRQRYTVYVAVKLLGPRSVIGTAAASA